MELTDRRHVRIRLDSSDDGARLEQWERYEKIEGCKIRPHTPHDDDVSAVLSDLFIHGIGGAKYDELTDEIIRRFFGIEPPR